MTRTKEQQANAIILSCLLQVNDLPEWTDNFERGQLYSALAHIYDGELEQAIEVLGQGVEHAFRENFTEARPEAAACKKAFDCLTARD